MKPDCEQERKFGIILLKLKNRPQSQRMACGYPERLRLFPSDGMLPRRPHLFTLMERGTVRGKCQFSLEENTVILMRAQIQSTVL